ncbi:MAG: two pore domain potassium channel family protein [Nitrospirae bacterium]|nr:MAG: two pore domain potassium channel family protein [Nitrospirota bacterium]
MKNPRRHGSRFRRFLHDVSTHTPFLQLIAILVGLWFIFSWGLYLAERGIAGTPITSLGQALYWGIAACSTAGIAEPPRSAMGLMLGSLWILVGSILFFGTIVATITTYFMRPMQRPVKKIIDTIEYNLEQLNDLTIEELDLLKNTVDTLITHVEQLKHKQQHKQLRRELPKT